VQALLKAEIVRRLHIGSTSVRRILKSRTAFNQADCA
jgi:hypothetical protein